MGHRPDLRKYFAEFGVQDEVYLETVKIGEAGRCAYCTMNERRK